MTKQTYIAISREELAIVNASLLQRLFVRRQYPIDVHSGREVKEFVALAAECKRMGAGIIDSIGIERLLHDKVRVIKIGRTDLERDIHLLSSVSSTSVWNQDNLEKVFYWEQYLKPFRRLWSVFLGGEEDLQKLSSLFDEHGRLFIKTRTKGNSRLYESYDDFRDSLGDLSLLVSSFRDLIVSEPIDIATVEVRVGGLMHSKPDEFRHYIINGELVASTRAFECDDPDSRASADHLPRVKEAMRYLKEKGFATTYVLDTCRLRSHAITEIEVNNLFSAGIYDFSVIQKLAEALVNS